ncbi:MAG: transposase, partial [Thaumarchaeota archaeon]|nr:transposase [Nitrososphaerota archaeon]
YFHKKSNHSFTLHQHIIMLVLRQYESKSYESFVEWLQVSDQIVQMLGLKSIPHFTTLQKAAARLSEILLHVAIGRFIGLVCPGRVFAGADATGFEDGHAASYYTHRISLKRSFARMAAASDVITQIIIAVVIRNHANGHEIRDFPALLKGLTDVVAPRVLVLDKGYDAEWVHQAIRKHGILSVIPVRNKSDMIGRIKGRCRKEMKRGFDDKAYHQRNKCETIFSVIKRRFSPEIRSYNDTMKERELLYRVLAYNCHRVSVISCLLWMVSMQPSDPNVF